MGKKIEGRWVNPVLVDSNTGEVISTQPPTYIPNERRKEKYAIDSEFVAFWQSNFDLLLELLEIRNPAARLFFVLIKEMGFDNFIHVEQAYLAELTKMKQSNVSRAMRFLVEKTIIVKGPKLGKKNTYKLNPMFGWKGTKTNFNKSYKDLSKDVIELFKKEEKQ